MDVMIMVNVAWHNVYVKRIGSVHRVNLLGKIIVMIDWIMIKVRRTSFYFYSISKNISDGLIDCLDPDCCSSSQCQSIDECTSRATAKDMYPK